MLKKMTKNHLARNILLMMGIFIFGIIIIANYTSGSYNFTSFTSPTIRRYGNAINLESYFSSLPERVMSASDIITSLVVSILPAIEFVEVGDVKLIDLRSGE